MSLNCSYRSHLIKCQLLVSLFFILIANKWFLLNIISLLSNLLPLTFFVTHHTTSKNRLWRLVTWIFLAPSFCFHSSLRESFWLLHFAIIFNWLCDQQLCSCFSLGKLMDCRIWMIDDLLSQRFWDSWSLLEDNSFAPVAKEWD